MPSSVHVCNTLHLQSLLCLNLGSLPTSVLECAGAGQYRDKANHFYCKFWWAATLSEAGYAALFLDNGDNCLATIADQGT